MRGGMSINGRRQLKTAAHDCDEHVVKSSSIRRLGYPTCHLFRLQKLRGIAVSLRKMRHAALQAHQARPLYKWLLHPHLDMQLGRYL